MKLSKIVEWQGPEKCEDCHFHQIVWCYYERESVRRNSDAPACHHGRFRREREAE